MIPELDSELPLTDAVGYFEALLEWFCRYFRSEVFGTRTFGESKGENPKHTEFPIHRSSRVYNVGSLTLQPT